MPYAPCTLAAGHVVSSKPMVFHPSGGDAGVPGRAFQVLSVTIRVESSCAVAITPLASAAFAIPAIAITFVPGTSSDLMSLTCEFCHELTTVPGELDTSVPFT